MSSGVLVGRDNDLAAVVDAHRSKDIDLVVVVGAAGVGKSHLAAAVPMSAPCSLPRRLARR